MNTQALTSISPICRRLLLVCVVGALMSLPVSDAPAHSIDLDCSDFGSQAAAQEHRDHHAGDPDRLDDDEDGTACEELPCPCGVTVLPPATAIATRPQGALPAPLTMKARVTGVIDGNALKVRLPAGQIVYVGLIGIDSAERGEPGPRGQCGAPDAAARMKRLAMRNGVGRIVTLQTDPTQHRVDPPDRLPVYVSVRGVDFGRTMIAAGMAKVHVVERDFARLTTYREAQASAKAAKRGVWRGCGG